VTQHLVVVKQNDPRTFWSWEQNQNDDVVVPFQHILMFLVSMLDEGDIAETVQGCRLNSN
jgi:hypothetical protein